MVACKLTVADMSTQVFNFPSCNNFYSLHHWAFVICYGVLYLLITDLMFQASLQDHEMKKQIQKQPLLVKVLDSFPGKKTFGLYR